MLAVRIPRRHGSSRLYLALFTAAFTVLAFQLLLGIDLWGEDGTDSSIIVTSVCLDEDDGYGQRLRSGSQVLLTAPLPNPWRPGDLELFEMPESDDDKVLRWNQRELSEMHLCEARGECLENQPKNVMFHTHWVMGTLVGRVLTGFSRTPPDRDSFTSGIPEKASGELRVLGTVLRRARVMSMVKAIRRLGYTVLLSNDSESKRQVVAERGSQARSRRTGTICSPCTRSCETGSWPSSSAKRIDAFGESRASSTLGIRTASQGGKVRRPCARRSRQSSGSATFRTVWTT